MNINLNNLNRPDQWEQPEASPIEAGTEEKQWPTVAIQLNPRSDLTQGKIEALLSLIDTPEKRRGVVSALLTVPLNLEGLFIYADSPMKGQKAHPLFKSMTAINEIVGCLLLGGDLVVHQRSSAGGLTAEVVGRSNGSSIRQISR